MYSLEESEESWSKKMQLFPQNCTKCEVFDPKSAKKGADLLDFSLLNRLSLKLTFYFMKIVGSPKNLS